MHGFGAEAEGAESLIAAGTVLLLRRFILPQTGGNYPFIAPCKICAVGVLEEKLPTFRRGTV
jgi:hypothetical protein